MNPTSLARLIVHLVRRSSVWLLGLGALVAWHPARAQPSVSWIEVETAQERARTEGKPLFVFVEAAWCSQCKRMKRDVFPDETIRTRLARRYLPVAIDLDSKAEIRFDGERMTERAFARSMNVRGTPTLIFIDPDGDVLGTYTGFASVEDLGALLDYVVSDRFGEISFEAFRKTTPPQ